MKSARPTYEQRQAERVAMAAMKAREKELKEEKAQKKKVRYLHPSPTTARTRADGFTGANTSP
jgi:hypothetical protein